MKKLTINKIFLVLFFLELSPSLSLLADNEKILSEDENEDKTKEVFNFYLKITDSLISADTQLASLSAKGLLSFLEGDSDLILKIKTNAKSIAMSKDIGKQRKAFSQLSDAMYELLKGSEKEGIIYRQFCPMAFNKKGAFWLSEKKEINNPYFGKPMLRCGSTKEEF